MSSPFDPNQMLLSGFRTDQGPKWIGLANMIEKRQAFAAVSLDDHRIMVIGGRGGCKALTTVVVYDKTTNEWTSDDWPDLNEKRFNHSAAMCNNKVYVFGGYMITMITIIACVYLQLNAWICHHLPPNG